MCNVDPVLLSAAAPADGPFRDRCILTVDVEDWFHILDLPVSPSPESWSELPSRVEINFLRLLDLFDRHQASVTCFFLGWVARKFPRLVTEARRRGHEVASHGYAHRLAYQMSPQEFREDALRARRLLEDIAGCRVIGFRCPGFSVTSRLPWVFQMLVEAGYGYDSSVFPARRLHGGYPEAPLVPHRLHTPSGDLAEFPVTVAEFLGRRLCVFGGGYFRAAPLGIILRMAARVLAEGRPVLFYLHPRDIDPDQPRLPMPLGRKLRCYVNLTTTEQKLKEVLGRFQFTTCAAYLEAARLLGSLPSWVSTSSVLSR
jgi:polysaccharide deacetylase family protein (PEP-CTERM system associated)